MKKIVYTFLMITIIFTSCSNDDDVVLIDVTDKESLTQRLDQILEKSNFPGFTIGIVKDGKIALQESFGYQNLEDQIPYNNKTLQSIGSISKIFIGVATIKAIALGYFTLETPINDILPRPIINPKNPSAVIRVKHLVNHTSGLIDENNVYLSSYYLLSNQNLSTSGTQIMESYGITSREPKTLQQFIEAYFYKKGDYYSDDNFYGVTPGTQEIYTNVGASLMAYIIQESSGMKYPDFIKVNILDPLKMTSTSFYYDQPLDQYATLYFNKNTPLPLYNLESFPDGALKTSNEDIMKFFLDMIRGQQGLSTTLFNKEYYELLFTATSENFTVFWDILDNEKGTFGHTGGDPGLSTQLLFSEASNAGFYVISNYDASIDEHEAHYKEIASQINKSINMYLSN
ncbi:serine hydrolase domain-containing protein [Aquimarina algicola]|uniref:Beta-lactamase family protein n=1 Tax=Aquimarina algicola TaxID=2589995 RepID=A0A504J1C1_9FLAO|nr:serine hydrolase domain-containing protein [Aquimarina algicola]TPN82262.1 beta-lactamase family protein [Aquimarina algicola]